MSIIDKNLEIASAVALGTGGTGLALVGSQIDLTMVSRDLGMSGRPLYLVIQISTGVTSAGAATVEFQAVSDAQVAIAVDGTATVHGKTGAIAKATLIAGYTFIIPLGPLTGERYLGLLQNVGTAALTAGAVNCWVTDSLQRWVAYPDAL